MSQPERYIEAPGTVAITILCDSYIYRQQVRPAPKKRSLRHEGSERRGIFCERRRERSYMYIHTYRCYIEVRRYIECLRVSHSEKYLRYLKHLVQRNINA